MPYSVKKSEQCPESKPWACMKTGTGEVMGCHETQGDAEAQMAALYAQEGGMMTDSARAAISSHSTATTEEGPGGPEVQADAPNSAEVLRYMHAWYSGENPDQKGSYKFPHHSARVGSAAILPLVRNGLSRLPQSNIPSNDVEGVRRHLQRHLQDAQRALDVDQARRVRSSALQGQPAATPCGAGRSQAFPSELRAENVQRDGQAFVRVDGYASIVEHGYEMWDTFGPYKEVVSRSAFDATLAANPDVAFLVNHRGLLMARTTNGSLELSADTRGLRSVAYLNPKRQDVRDLVVAIEDRDVTEMSFAFLIEDGTWSEDFTEYRIERVSLDRGDVSAVNYGANPYTSIAARSHEIIDALDQLPAGAARAALEKLNHRDDLAHERKSIAPSPELLTMGRSVQLVQAELLADLDE